MIDDSERMGAKWAPSPNLQSTPTHQARPQATPARPPLARPRTTKPISGRPVPTCAAHALLPALRPLALRRTQPQTKQNALATQSAISLLLSAQLDSRARAIGGATAGSAAAGAAGGVAAGSSPVCGA